MTVNSDTDRNPTFREWTFGCYRPNWDWVFPPLLFFFSNFGLAWIVQWDYLIIADESAAFPTIGRTFKTKWWDASLNAVKQYFLKHPTQASTNDEMSQFLLKKQQLQAMLAAAKTPQEFQKILDEGSSSFSQDNSYAESNDSTSYLPDNGDDCEGILPPVRKYK